MYTCPTGPRGSSRSKIEAGALEDSTTGAASAKVARKLTTVRVVNCIFADLWLMKKYSES